MKHQLVTSKFPTDGKEQLAAVAHPAMTDFEKSGAELASSLASQDSQNLKFEREDWTCFRTVEGLQQKAGVAKDKLRRLVLKELADNGLDLGGKVDTGELPDGGYFIEDDGGGIDGTPEEVARLFSIGRPMISTKLTRLPTRGALGNGLRVVAGAVLASEGTLVVITRNRRIVLRPERDGTTSVVSADPVDFSVGTRIEISFGPALPSDENALHWAEIASGMAGKGQTYAGKSSPWWYDTTQFHELLTASATTLVRDLISSLDGCTGGKAGEIIAAAELGRALYCKDITSEQARRLLVAARENTKQVNPERLGAVGANLLHGYAYVCVRGFAKFGSTAPFAEVPFACEAWVSAEDDDAETSLTMCVNRTPVTGDIEAAHAVARCVMLAVPPPDDLERRPMARSRASARRSVRAVIESQRPR